MQSCRDGSNSPVQIYDLAITSSICLIGESELVSAIDDQAIRLASLAIGIRGPSPSREGENTDRNQGRRMSLRGEKEKLAWQGDASKGRELQETC